MDGTDVRPSVAHPRIRFVSSLHGRTVTVHLGRGTASQRDVLGVSRLAQAACRTRKGRLDCLSLIYRGMREKELQQKRQGK